MNMSGQLHTLTALSLAAPRTHWTGGWVATKASLDVVQRENNPFHIPARNRTLVIYAVAWPLYCLSNRSEENHGCIWPINMFDADQHYS
jgi:hypothetical protein